MTARHTIRRILTATSLAVAAACDAPTAPTDPAPSLEPAGHQAVQVPDADLLARTVPGFGGFYLDDEGVPTVYLTDVRRRGAAEAALAGYAAAHGFSTSQIRVVRGDYPYTELKGHFEQLAPVALALEGAVLADLDEARNRVVVGVENAQAAAQVRAASARLGLPGLAVVVEEVEPIHFVATLRDAVRPVVGGLQINFAGSLCTLGFNALDDGVSSFITASHCTTTKGGVESTPYWQPLSTVAESFIGTEVEDPAYFTGGSCPATRRCRYSDAARAAYADGVSVSLGQIAQTGKPRGSIAIAGSYTITAESATDPAVGERVSKVGRTTGRTSGRVTNTCVMVNVAGQDITQLCQALVKAEVGAGDSGSPVFSGSASVTLYGILWGGNFSGTSFAYSPLKNLERADELGSLTTF